MTTCPFCKDSVSDLDAVQCPTCDAAHHEECWEANGETCSVYGCKSSIEEGLLGCPWCEEMYTVARRFCMVCNQPLMNAREYRNFMERYDWVRLKLPEDQNILLTAGYLRNRGVVARINKGTRGIAAGMLGFRATPTLEVPMEEEELAHDFIRELSDNFTECDVCGHVLMREEECSFCSEEGIGS
jgi:hypothetical protein